MPYISEEGGRLNNFAKEPKMYTATPPDKKQQRNYLIQGILGASLVVGLIVLAVSVSNMG